MVTLNKIKDTSNTNALFLCGLSTDTKPVDKVQDITVSNGSEYLEIDTGKKYVFDEENSLWIETSDNISGFSKSKVRYIGKFGDEKCYEIVFEHISESVPWTGTKLYNLSVLISGFTIASKVIDYSVVLKTEQGRFVKTSLVGSGMDMSAYLTDGKTLSVYSSESIIDAIVKIQYIA